MRSYANNEGQIHKTVFSKNEPGEKIMIMQAMTDTEEGFHDCFRYFRQEIFKSA